MAYEKTESRSTQEPKVLTVDWRLDTRKRVNNMPYSQESLRVNETDQAREHEESETDSRPLPHKKRASVLDWPTPRQQETISFQYKNMETTLDWAKINELKRRLDERNESDYPLRPEERSCSFYTKTGLCGYGRNCVLNHPRCKYFLRGDCKHGSACQFIHPKNLKPSSRPEKRAKFNYPDFRERSAVLGEGEITREQENMKSPWILRLEKMYNKDISEICDIIVAGIKQRRMEEERKKDIEKQRKDIEKQDEC